MVRDAESHAEEDKKKKEVAEVRNNADGMVFATEKSLKEYGDKVSAEDKKAIEDALADLKSAIESDDIDVDDVKAKTEELTQASMKLGEAMYQEQAAQAVAADAGEASSESEKDDDDVVDAEFTEVKDDDSEDKKSKKKKSGTDG